MQIFYIYRMNAFTLPIQKTAFCSVLGDAAKPTDIWFVLHGYGQLSQYFIQHFTAVLNEQTVVAAPEAPSRFYLNNDYGRVGASWMTKHERETDIADLNGYLNQVFDEVCKRYQADDTTRFHFLAFSQGVPVLCRWLAQREVNVYQLILWAGAVPHDMQMENLKHLLERGKSYVVYGTEDPYLKEAQFPMLQTVLNERQLPVEIKTFKGAHTLDAELLKALSEER